MPITFKEGIQTTPISEWLTTHQVAKYTEILEIVEYSCRIFQATEFQRNLCKEVCEFFWAYFPDNTLITESFCEAIVSHTDETECKLYCKCLKLFILEASTLGFESLAAVLNKWDDDKAQKVTGRSLYSTTNILFLRIYVADAIVQNIDEKMELYKKITLERQKIVHSLNKANIHPSVLIIAIERTFKIFANRVHQLFGKEPMDITRGKVTELIRYKDEPNRRYNRMHTYGVVIPTKYDIKNMKGILNIATTLGRTPHTDRNSGPRELIESFKSISMKDPKKRTFLEELKVRASSDNPQLSDEELEQNQTAFGFTIAELRTMLEWEWQNYPNQPAVNPAP